MTRGAVCFLLSACFAWTLGCGARTSTLEEEDLGGAYPGGASGGTPVGGSNHGGSGGSFAGSSPVAGAGGSFGGGPPIAGAGGSFGGFGATGGSSGSAGFAGFGAFGGFGGVAGTAGVAGAGGISGSGGIGELCSVLGASSCEQCVCQTCAVPIVSCFSDVGCAFIFACTQQTGCQGLGCYSPNTCRSVIDQFGGLTGSSANKLFALASCSVTSQDGCNCN